MHEQNALTPSGPSARQIYKQLLTKVKQIGPYKEEIKKTSVHLVRTTAFAGVQLRKEHLILTIKSAKPLEGPRVHKCEQTSKNRWHPEIKLTSAEDLNEELQTWLRQAYDLCG